MAVHLGGGMAEYIPDTRDEAIAILLAGNARFRASISEGIDLDFNGISRRDYDKAESLKAYFHDADWGEVVMKFKKEVA